MLAATLRSLEREGLVARTASATKPPRVEYALTALGRSVKAPLIMLADWAADHALEMKESREAFDGASRTASQVDGRVTLSRNSGATHDTEPAF